MYYSLIYFLLNRTLRNGRYRVASAPHTQVYGAAMRCALKEFVMRPFTLENLKNTEIFSKYLENQLVRSHASENAFKARQLELKEV
jgi:hypothetical protein